MFQTSGLLPVKYSRHIQQGELKHTRSTLEDLHIPPELGTPRNSPRGAVGCSLGERMSATLFSLLLLRPREVAESGWIEI